MERVRLPVAGMTCTSCVARITRAVRRLDGVHAVRVDLATDAVIVTYDPARVSLDTIAAAVVDARLGVSKRRPAAVHCPAAPSAS